MDFSQTLLTQEDNVPFDAAASERDIYNCFRLILGRYASRAEWEGHRRHAGRPLASVAAKYVDSIEYKYFRNNVRKPDLARLPGFSLYASPEDLLVGNNILANLEWEPHVTRLFVEHLSEGMTVLDIGANIGYFTFLAASRVGPSGRVWAIEPNHRNVSYLLATRALNGFRQVEIIQAAASDRWEVLCLATDYSNGTVIKPDGTDPDHFSEPVMAFPLDAVLSTSGQIGVIKIDVEGAEARALKGMLTRLESDRPVVFSEFTPSALPPISGVSPGDYLSLFTDRGYSLTVLEKSGPKSMTASALLEYAAAMSANTHLDILAEPVRPS